MDELDDASVVGQIVGGILMIDAGQIIEVYVLEVARREFVNAVAAGTPASEAWSSIRRKADR